MNTFLLSPSHLAALALSCSFLFAAGCADELVCTTEARPSVLVDVVDIDGNPLTGAAVTYTHDTMIDEPCVAMGDPGRYWCGYELRGPITVRANLVGYTEASTAVVVSADRCHVITQTVELTLEALGPG